MEHDWKRVLTSLVEIPEMHSRFLNTISLMEYMGARKIIKSQMEDWVDEHLLAHISEEIRHARVFKKMALKLSEGKLTSYQDCHLLAGQQARSYIQSVDRSVAAALEQENTRENYLLSTLLIEQRAALVYPFYAQRMIPLGFGPQISNVLKEEQHHLEQIRGYILQSGSLDLTQMEVLYKMEQQAFEALMEAVAEKIHQAVTQQQGTQKEDLFL